MTDYSAHVRSPGEALPADSGSASEAFSALMTGADAPYPNWKVPVELVYALAGEAMQTVIRTRQARGPKPKPDAIVWARTGEFYAIVDFEGADRTGLLFRLSAWPWENRR